MICSQRANAKVNLTLRITGRRQDGYHLLESLVVFASIGDRVTVSPAASPHTSLTITGPFGRGLPNDGANLVLRAADALAKSTGRTLSAEIVLEKNLPVAAGIGGGSADAAACLHILNAYWNIHLDHAALAEIALSLGADVPACLTGAPVRMTGIGEILTPIPNLPPLGILLVNDGTACPTGPVFDARTAAFSMPRTVPAKFDNRAELIRFLHEDQNDLEAPALSLHPSIAQVKDAVSALPDCLLGRMSGSGATVFGLFETEKEASQAAASLASKTGWWCMAGSVLPGHPSAA